VFTIIINTTVKPRKKSTDTFLLIWFPEIPQYNVRKTSDTNPNILIISTGKPAKRIIVRATALMPTG
jgi:hypothetical protein